MPSEVEHLPKVVLDTQAALDWLVFDDPRIAPLAATLAAGQTRWLTTLAIRLEFAEVLLRPAIRHRVGSRKTVLRRYDALTQVRPAPAPNPAGLRCTDPDDQVFVDLSWVERPAWLVTRDKALLALRGRAAAHSMRIIEPWQCLP